MEFPYTTHLASPNVNYYITLEQFSNPENWCWFSNNFFLKVNGKISLLAYVWATVGILSLQIVHTCKTFLQKIPSLQRPLNHTWESRSAKLSCRISSSFWLEILKIWTAVLTNSCLEGLHAFDLLKEKTCDQVISCFCCWFK